MPQTPSIQAAACRLYCIPARQPAYAATLAKLAHQVEVYENMDDLITQCLINPPAAVMLDVMSAATEDRDVITALSHLNVNWPVMRAIVTPDGQAVVMWVEGCRREPLTQAVEEIKQGDLSWRNAQFPRQQLRVQVELRARFRRPSQERSVWQQTNLLNISIGGLFAVTYEPIVIGERLEVEVLDLLGSPLRLAGEARWVRHWDTSHKIPGVGIMLDGSGDIERYRQVLGNPTFVTQVRKHII